jgi:hypothetical protein
MPWHKPQLSGDLENRGSSPLEKKLTVQGIFTGGARHRCQRVNFGREVSMSAAPLALLELALDEFVLLCHQTDRGDE